MQQLTTVLDQEIHALDTVLLRLTTVRLLLASGKHGMVPQGLEELDDAIDRVEETALEAQRALGDAGFTSFEEATAVLDLRDRADVEQRLAAVNARHRDVRVALTATGGTAERAIRNAADHLPDVDVAVASGARRHGFITGA